MDRNPDLNFSACNKRRLVALLSIHELRYWLPIESSYTYTFVWGHTDIKKIWSVHLLLQKTWVLASAGYSYALLSTTTVSCSACLLNTRGAIFNTARWVKKECSFIIMTIKYNAISIRFRISSFSVRFLGPQYNIITPLGMQWLEIDF